MSNPEQDGALARELDDAVRTASFAHQVADQLQSSDSNSPEHAQLALAFKFSRSRGSGEDGPYFKPVFVFDGEGPSEQELDGVGGETLALWDRIADLAEAAEAKARLHDLLFERRHGNVGEHAACAIDAYLQYGSRAEPPEFDAVEALLRALGICELTRSPRTPEVKEAMLKAAERCLEESDEKPGIVVRLLEALVADRNLSEVDGLLQRACDRYVGKLHAVESIIGLQRRRSTSDGERRALDEGLIRMLLAHADNCDALVSAHLRERAAGLARDRGLPHLADEAVAAMQRGPKPELARFGTEINLDSTQVEQHIESMVGADWWESVQLILAHGPPSGRHEYNLKSAEETANASALMSLMPVTILGADGLPRYTASTDEQKADHRLTQSEQHAMQVLGRLHVSALFRALERFQPSTVEVVQPLRGVGRDEETAAAIAGVIQRLRIDDHTGALFVALPLIEATVRDLLLTIDAPLYRVQREKSPGTYPGLGALLPALAERGLDPSWHRYLRTLLASPNGFNIRNEALHGFVHESDAFWAGLTAIALLFVGSLQTGPQDDDTAGQVDI